jgi:hypothetical protein
MIRHILKNAPKNEINDLRQALILELNADQTVRENNYKKVVLGIKASHELAPSRQKLQLLSIVADKIPRSELLHTFKWDVNLKHYNNAKDHATLNGVGSDVNSGGRPKISATIKPLIENFVRQSENSYPAGGSRSTLINKGKPVATIRYRNASVKELFKRFKFANPNIQVSNTKFSSLLPKWLKKAKKASDYCPNCKIGTINETFLASHKDKHAECTFIECVKNNKIECQKVHSAEKRHSIY